MLTSGSHVDKYLIKGTLGSGGMAVVYRALDTLTGRTVALKYCLHGEAGPSALERFQREAVILGRLDHPNIVKLYDVQLKGDSIWFAMELVEGVSVDSLVARARNQGHRHLPCGEVLTVLLGVARALAAAHAQGILHRDLKPGNVMVEEPSGRTVLLDFGLARGGGTKTLTSAGMVLGTLCYLSPEQLLARPCSPATDVYEFGLMAHHLLTGKLPWQGPSGDDVTLAVRRTTENVPPIMEVEPELDPRVAALVMRCLEREPSARWADGAELLAALEPLAGGKPEPEPEPEQEPEQGRATVKVGADGQAKGGGGARALERAPIPLAPGRSQAPGIPLWAIPLVVLTVLWATGALPRGGRPWPPRDLAAEPGLMGAVVTWTSGRPERGYTWSAIPLVRSGAGQDAPSAQLFAYPDAEPPRTSHRLAVTGLAPETGYQLELRPISEPTAPAAVLAFRTRDLGRGRLTLRGSGGGRASLEVPTIAPVRLSVRAVGAGPATTVAAEAAAGTLHLVELDALLLRSDLSLAWTSPEGTWVQSLETAELVQRSLDELLDALRTGAPAAPDAASTGQLPSPETLAAALRERVVELTRRGLAAPVAQARFAEEASAWASRLKPLLARDGGLVGALVSHRGVALDRRRDLAGAVAAVDYAEVCSAGVLAPGAPPPPSCLPDCLRSLAALPSGWRPVLKHRYSAAEDVFHPGKRYVADRPDAKEFRATVRSLEAAVVRGRRLLGVAVSTSQLTPGFLPVLSVNGVPLYPLRPEHLDATETSRLGGAYLRLVHVIPSCLLHEGEGNVLALRVYPEGMKSERVGRPVLELYGDVVP